jgi:precorrin-2 dehydrogenase
MPPLPAMLNIQGKRCVIVGGGPVALRRARALLAAGAIVVVIAPKAESTLAELPIEHHQRPYHRDDVANTTLVVVATDDPQVNEAVSSDARAAGALVNRADAPELSDFTVPAHTHHGPITLAVGTGGVSASAAAVIRRQLSDALDPDWTRLLAHAASYRTIIQQRFDDPEQRRERLIRLADTDAMAILKNQGDQALLDHYRGLTEPGT